MWFDKDNIERVRLGTDWVQILHRLGIEGQAGRREYRACCPFHEDTRPSFYFELRRGLFYCHGCGCRGDGFGLVMRLRGLSFPQAVQWVAGQGDPRPSSEGLLDALVTYYHQQLWRSDGAQQFLRARGITDPDLWRRCGIGYAPGGRCAQRLLLSRGYSLEQVRGAGLLNRRGLDVLFQRVTLPIVRGSTVVNVYGRNLGAGFTHMYLPGPRGGLVGWEEAHTRDRGILVEGLFDWLTLRQCGYGEALSAMSANVSHRQIELLRRARWQELLVAFDHDPSGAGQRAARALAHKLTDAACRVRLVVLPPGRDVNDCLVQEHMSRVDFDALLTGAQPC